MSLTDNFIVDKYGRLLRKFPDRIIFGKTFEEIKTIKELFGNCEDKIGFISEFQEKKLSNLIEFAIKNTKFYKNISSPDFFRDFKKIPFVDKHIFQTNFNSLLATKKKSDYVTTGGTSGPPFGFYIGKNRKGREWYFITSLWKRVGFKFDSSYRAVLRNHILRDGNLVRHNSFLREYIFSNYNLNDDYLKEIAKFLKNNNVEFFHAYPSAAYHFSEFLLRKQIEIPSLKSFLCSSENVFPYQRELIEKRLGIRLFSFYGHSEKLLLAGECEHSSFYHFEPFYGFAELIDSKGNSINTPGEVGEIVGTGFWNYSMPFIRYKTGDFAEYVGEQCPYCGRYGLIVKNLVGRWSGEKVFSKSGSFVTTTALNMHSSIYENISDFQYYQEDYGVLFVRVVPKQSFSNKDVNLISGALIQKLGDGFEVVVQTVPEIEFTKNRKYKLLIQKIDCN